MSRSALPYLGGLLALQAVGLAVMATTLDPHWQPPEPVKASLDVGVLDTPAVPPMVADEGSDFVRRPLFWESRKPFAVAGPAPAVVEDIFADLQLVGVFGSGDSGGAIVRHHGAVRRVRLGQDFEGWRLERVEGTRLVFSGSGTQHVVVLKHAEQTRAPAPAAPPQPGAAGAAPTPPPAGGTPPAASGAPRATPPAAPAATPPARPSREERNAQLNERRRQIREKMGL